MVPSSPAAIAASEIRRQAIVVLSDGEDTSSLLPFEEVLDLAKRSETAIYSIGLRAGDGPATTTKGFKEAEFVLRQFSQETGGRAFFPYHIDDLDQSFQDIGDELRNQYSIAYIPTHSQFDGKYHRIRIEVPEHKGYQVRARRGYFAKANSSGAAGTSPSGSAN